MFVLLLLAFCVAATVSAGSKQALAVMTIIVAIAHLLFAAAVVVVAVAVMWQ